MPHARRLLGDRGELLAERFLVQHGYQVLAHNYRCPYGEIDLICRDGSILSFVEVKTRRGTRFGEPEEAITPAKLAHLARCAEYYLGEQNGGEESWRIDVVAIALYTTGKHLETRLITGVGG